MRKVLVLNFVSLFILASVIVLGADPGESYSYIDYQYKYVGSVYMGATAWRIIDSEWNNSSVSEHFTYTTTEKTVWQWSINITLMNALGISGGVSGSKERSISYNLYIPPLMIWKLYDRFETNNYNYVGKKVKVTYYDNGDTNVEVLSTFGFHEKVVSEDHKTDLIPIRSGS